MAKSQFSISLFFTLLCLWSATAVFGREIPAEENSNSLLNESLDSLGQNWASRIETLEENQEDLIKTNLEQTREISAQNETLQRLVGVLSFVQNELESKAGKNETDILDKELKDLRREFSDLTTNGSTFSNRALTTTCGGLVTVQNEHKIRYQVPQVPSQENQPKSCIWIVKNSQPQGLSLDLTDIKRSQDFQLWALNSFTPGASSFVTKMRALGAKLSIPESFFVLCFHTNFSSTKNNSNNETISFNLNIRSNTSSSTSYQPFVKIMDLGLSPNSNSNSTGSLQSFKYPLPPSTQYLDNERTFIILKPTRAGNNLWLKMKSLQTESGADWFSIYTFREWPIFRTRLTGSLTTEQEIRSAKDETMIIFFGSDSSVRGSGFSFDYTEENETTRAPTTQTQSTCGGFVSVTLEAEISYQVPPNPNSSVCIWVVKHVYAGGLQVELADQDRWTNDESTELFIIHSFSGNSSQKLPIVIQDPSVNFSSQVGSYFLLYFRFNPNLQNHNNSSSQGFKLRIQENSQEFALNSLIISRTELIPSSTPTEKKEFSYPVARSQYQSNERAFIIIKPTAVGSKIKMEMSAISTEARYDHVHIMSYSEQEEKMVVDFSFSGTLNPSSLRTFKGRENEPVVVFFTSDGSTTSTGFKFTYSEVRTNARS